MIPKGEYRVEIDNLSESDWSDMLDRFEDANIYQTWSYGAIRWGKNNLSHLVLMRGDEVRGIAQLRIVRPNYLRIGIAYLRWGPLCHPSGEELDFNTIRAMATALREEYVDKRGLYLEILPNAFLGSTRAEMYRSAFSEFDCKSGIAGEKYRTFVLDLSPSIEELRGNLDKKWRNQLSAAERKYLKVIEGVGREEYRIFSKLYTEMLERKKFESTVSIEEFGRIQEHLSAKQRLRILICEQAGQPVAGIVCSELGQSAIYLLGATSEEGMKSKGAYLLQWAMIRSLKEKGIRYYDLGGIDPEMNPGVHHFKSGLSGVDLCHISPLIACDNRFSAILAKAGQVLHGGLRRYQHGFANG